jgi:hypothetical protein
MLNVDETYADVENPVMDCIVVRLVAESGEALTVASP